MSVIPIAFRDWWDDYWGSWVRTSPLLDPQFGSEISADDLLTAFTSAVAAQPALLNKTNKSRIHYNRPRRNLTCCQDSGSAASVSDDTFQINIDVQHFSPEQISVKVTDDSIRIEGKHEEKQDEHGYISRHFVRRYVLPADHDINSIVSSLSSDGILTVTVPKKALPEPEGLKTIPIVQTGHPVVKDSN